MYIIKIFNHFSAGPSREFDSSDENDANTANYDDFDDDDDDDDDSTRADGPGMKYTNFILFLIYCKY